MKQVLLLCTGNTCRSPMAQVMLTRMIQEAGLADEVEAASAGIYAANGQPASHKALQVMEKRGLSLSNHRSRRLTPRMIQEASLILGMTEEHKQAVLMVDAAASEKVFSLGEFVADASSDHWQQVPDPFGQPVNVYEQTAQVLKTLLMGVVKKLEEERMVE